MENYEISRVVFISEEKIYNMVIAARDMWDINRLNKTKASFIKEYGVQKYSFTAKHITTTTTPTVSFKLPKCS